MMTGILAFIGAGLAGWLIHADNYFVRLSAGLLTYFVGVMLGAKACGL